MSDEIPTLDELASWSPYQAALEALRVLDRLPTEDTARPDWRAAAQTFASLAVAEAVSEVQP